MEYGSCTYDAQGDLLCDEVEEEYTDDDYTWNGDSEDVGDDETYEYFYDEQTGETIPYIDSEQQNNVYYTHSA